MCFVNSDVDKFIVLIDIYYYRSVVPRKSIALCEEEYLLVDCTVCHSRNIGKTCRLYCLPQNQYQQDFVGCTAHD